MKPEYYLYVAILAIMIIGLLDSVVRLLKYKVFKKKDICNNCKDRLICKII